MRFYLPPILTSKKIYINKKKKQEQKQKQGKILFLKCIDLKFKLST